MSSKVIFIGSMGVGKTTLMTRIATGKCPESTTPTTAASYYQYTPPGHDDVLIQFWDTSGMEKFRAINSVYYREACAAAITFDLTDRRSFEDLGMWLGDFEKSTAMASAVKFLVGNKCDLMDDIVVEEETARRWADDKNIQYFSLSAFTGEGVSEFVDALVQCLPRLPKPRPLDPSPAPSNAVPEKSDCC
jgi:small GTP-binding protein